jgi:hypothetical protein
MYTCVSYCGTCARKAQHSAGKEAGHHYNQGQVLGDAPAVAEYLPAGHDVQVAAANAAAATPLEPYWPASHTEPEDVEAPVTDRQTNSI